MSLRRVIQLFSLFLFLFLLFAALAYVSTAWPVDLFLRLDPSLVTLTALSARVLLPAFLPVVVLLGATLILGRFFCSHVCPMGTTLELLGKLKLFAGKKKFSLHHLEFS